MRKPRRPRGASGPLERGRGLGELALGAAVGTIRPANEQTLPSQQHHADGRQVDVAGDHDHRDDNQLYPPDIPVRQK